MALQLAPRFMIYYRLVLIMETEPITPRKQTDGNSLTIIGMLLGAAIGASVALVYSRGTGAQNRRALNLWAHHRLDDIQHKVEGAVKREP